MKTLTVKLFLLEAKKAFLETLFDGVGIVVCIALGCLALALVGVFLCLPVLVAMYFEVMPEFTDYTLFQNWLSITECFWVAFWVVTANRLAIKLDLYKKEIREVKC
jgi:hypothetical protein